MHEYMIVKDTSGRMASRDSRKSHGEGLGRNHIREQFFLARGFVL